MFVPLGGGAMDGGTIISPIMNSSANPLLQQFRPDLKGFVENTRTKFSQETFSANSVSSSSRAKSNQNIAVHSKKEPTTALDLTKSQPTDSALFCRGRSLSPGASSIENNIQNRIRHTSENSENEGSNSQDGPISPSTKQVKNKRDISPVTDIDQRTTSSALGNMISPIIPILSGEGMVSTPGGLLPQQEAMIKMQQKEFEVQLNFLKNKHLEFIKSQQQMQRQHIPQSHPQTNISRCEECNINFSKHQNYIAHKKYYCAANANKANPPPTTMHIVSDNDDEELPMSAQSNHQQHLPSISPRVPTPKKETSPTMQASVHRSTAKAIGQRTPSVSPSPSIGSNQSLPTGVSAVAMQAAAQAAINNFIAMSTSMPGKEGAPELMNGPTKEFLLLKQQQDLLNKDIILSKEATLQALKAAAAASSNSSHQDNTASNSTNPDSSSPSPQQKLLMCTSTPTAPPSRTPPAIPSATVVSHSNTSIASGLPLPHFCCEGCGIKFKSVSNLQAHQARYCAGLRKTVVDEVGMGNPFETMIKKLAAQHPQTSGQTTAALPPPSSHLMSGLQADMMSFLSAKSLEQQLHQVEAMQAAVNAAHLSETADKEDANPPTAGPAAMAAMAAAISAANAASVTTSNGLSSSLDTVAGSDDYCCILCGYKESSVDRLKDHINMHFIGHVKKLHHPTPSSPSNTNQPSDNITMSNTTKKSKSPQISPPSSAERGVKHCSNGNEQRIHMSPEPKRMKLDGVLGPHNNRSKSSITISPPIRRKTSDTRDSISPKIDVLSGSSSISSPNSSTKKFSTQGDSPHINQGATVSSEATTTPSNMRCTACDIGFSQMSNFLAHKKYYCRGLLSSSPTSVDIKPLPTGDAVKVGTTLLSGKEEDDDNGERQNP